MSQEIPKVVIAPEVYCYNLDAEYKCQAFNNMNCSTDCSARIGSLRQLLNLYRELIRYNSNRLEETKYYRNQSKIIIDVLVKEEVKQIRAAYNEDMHRGSKGGSSESDSNNRTSLKQKMKDNRPVETRWNSEERDQIKTLTEKFEAEHGKLPRLSRSPLSRTPRKNPPKEIKK